MRSLCFPGRALIHSTILAMALFWIVVFSFASSSAYVPENLLNPFGVVGGDYDDSGALGATWVRHDAAVYLFEPSPGEWYWWWDQALDATEARGMNFTPVISVAQCWMSGFATEGWDPSYPPVDLSSTWNPAFGYSASYYDFIYRLVDRYRGRIEHLCIEAEANSHWAGTADQYVRLLKTAYYAAHNADPAIQIFDSGIASEAWGATIAKERILSGLYTDQQILNWVNAYYDRSVYFPLHFTTMAALQSWLSSPFVADQIQRVNYMLDNMGGSIDRLNLKFTEYWWLYADVIDYIDRRTAAAGYNMPLKVNNEASVWPGASEDTFAYELIQQSVEGLRLGVERFHWFPVSNQATETPRIGLIDSLGAVRQTGLAYKHAARLINSHFEFSFLDLTVPNVRQYVFQHRTDPEHHLRICWYDNATHSPGSAVVRFYFPTNTMKVVRSDHVGRRSIARIAGETYMDITVSQSPIYVEYFQDLSATTDVPGATPALAPTLEQNYPNPFRPTTTIRYTVPGETGQSQDIRLTVYDVGGRAVRHLVSGTQSAGAHDAYWSGEDDEGKPVPPGIYLYRLESGSFRETRKMILSR